MKKYIRFFTAVMLVSLPMSLFLFWLVNRHSDRIIWQSCQPDGVKYGSFEPYCVSVVEGEMIPYILSPPWDWPRRHFLYIAPGPYDAAPSYGCYLDFPIRSQSDDDIRASSNVEWSNEGLTIVARSGIRIFVPKEAFIGGR
jgi:hypothetical protein